MFSGSKILFGNNQFFAKNKEAIMNVFDRIDHGDLAERNYSTDMKIFRRQIKNEAASVDTAIRQKVDQLEPTVLQEYVFERADVYRLMRRPSKPEMKRYPSLCMEIMEAMTTPEEKYAAFRFLTIAEQFDGDSSDSFLRDHLLPKNGTSAC
jgi:hypothetical protein